MKKRSSGLAGEEPCWSGAAVGEKLNNSGAGSFFPGGVTSPKKVLFEIKSCNDTLIGLDGGVASFENILDQNRKNTETLVCMEIFCNWKRTNSLILTKARALG